jgi:mono/diheme cytochrome c family protein
VTEADLEETVIRFATLVAFGLFVGACNSDGGDTGDDDTDGGLTQTEEILALTPDTANGATKFASTCTACHASDGSGVVGLGTDIRGFAAEDVIVSILVPPSELMVIPPMSDQEIADVSAYVETDL